MNVLNLEALRPFDDDGPTKEREHHWDQRRGKYLEVAPVDEEEPPAGFGRQASAL